MGGGFALFSIFDRYPAVNPVLALKSWMVIFRFKRSCFIFLYMVEYSMIVGFQVHGKSCHWLQTLA
jgi:hypothetical protein